ncbi:MAG: hypothetical protein QGH60_22195 [Phycisphaerae bacterium]|nr:hypothetical protein [Phycisphaerae bacterium]
MKICKWLLCVAMALTLTAGSALAVEGAKPKKKKPARARKARPKKPRNLLRGEYGIMASEVKLTAEQKAKFVELIKTQNEAKKALAEKAAPIKKELAEARKAKDKEKCKELGAKLKALKPDSKANKAALMALLTDEQKTAWASFSLYRNACRRFGRAKLTDDQKQAIRDICAKSDVKVTGDKKADAAALKALTANISAGVLTDEQRKAMVPKPRVKKPKPDRPKKPRDRKKKKPADQ